MVGGVADAGNYIHLALLVLDIEVIEVDCDKLAGHHHRLSLCDWDRPPPLPLPGPLLPIPLPPPLPRPPPPARKSTSIPTATQSILFRTPLPSLRRMARLLNHNMDLDLLSGWITAKPCNNNSSSLFRGRLGNSGNHKSSMCCRQ